MNKQNKNISSKNNKQLMDFSYYCITHPEERFWQALRNHFKIPFILQANKLNIKTEQFEEITDTFYLK